MMDTMSKEHGKGSHRREEAPRGATSKGSREQGDTGPSATPGCRSTGGGPAAEAAWEGRYGEAAPTEKDMPPCRMLLDAESLSQVTGTSILGWRAGNALLGCIASMDEDRRILLVTRSEDAYLIADLIVPHRRGGYERPRIGLDRLP